MTRSDQGVIERGAFKSLPRHDDVNRVGTILSGAFSKAEDEAWGSFDPLVAGMIAKLNMPSFEG